MNQGQKKEKASVLILTLFIVFFLSVIALSVSHKMRLNTKIIRRHIENQKSANIAESAVLLALAELKADKKDNEYDCYHDSWYEKFHDGKNIKNFKFKDSSGEDIGEYWINIIDEHSRLDINSVPEDIMANLIDQLSKKDNKKLIQGIADYRDALGPKRRIRSVFELLKAGAMDKNIFWGEDTDDNSVLDKWEDDLAESLPEDNGNGTLDLGVKDFFTVFTDGKINLNTVPEEILLSLPGMTKEVEQTIIDIRNKQSLQKEKDFETVFSVSQLTRQFMETWGTARSDIFRVIVMAKAYEAKNSKQIIAVVDRSSEPIRILYWREN